MEKSIKSIVAPYGIYLGLVLSLLTVLIYAFNLEIFTKWWVQPLNLLIIIVIGIFAVRKAKTVEKGVFKFKEAFSSFFIPVVIGTLISAVVSLLLFNVIDPEASEQLLELTVQSSREMLGNFGMAEAEIDQAVRELENNQPYSLKNFLMGYVFSLAFYAVIGLIIALIFREKDPNAA